MNALQTKWPKNWGRLITQNGVASTKVSSVSTKKELDQKRRNSLIPDPSYDLDGDGCVS